MPVKPAGLPRPRGGREWLGGMVLRPVPESVAWARRCFRHCLDPYEPACSVGDCLLLLSELVTNALANGQADQPWRIRVHWYRVGDALRVDVHNPGSPARVQLRNATAGEEHGRGLALVDALADEWWAAPSAYGGTVVAFTMGGAFKPGAPGC